MKKGSHHLFLVWLIFTGMVIFSVFITWHEDLLILLYTTDQSRICYAISLLYIGVTIHCAKRFYLISSQINDSGKVEAMIRENANLEFHLEGEKVHINGNTTLPDCIVTNYIHDLLNKANNNNKNNETEAANTELIEVYESKLKGPHDIGWFLADLMIKLGLLGTIIGFILMMSSVADITDFDITAMQEVLQKMSTGMGTALFTTLAGLACNMLATAQYHTLDRSVDELLETTRHLTQVYIMPRLK